MAAGTRAGLVWGRNIKILADLASQDIADFTVTRNGRAALAGRVTPDAMLATLSFEVATVFA
jgi:hypothetical protein